METDNRNSIVHRISDFYVLEFRYIKDCIILVRSNLTADLVGNIDIMLYPFLGILEAGGHPDYIYYLLAYLAAYVLEYTCVLILYFLFLFSFTLAAYTITLGPMAFPLAVLHGIQFGNMVACHELRKERTTGALNLQKITVYRYKISLSSLRAANGAPVEDIYDPPVPWFQYFRRAEFWWGALPTMAVQYLVTIIIFAIWYIISLIPIIGVTLFKMHTSPHRGFDYILPFYRNTLQYDEAAITRIYYGGYGRWILLGISTGILESIPFLAGMAVCTNLVGCTLYGIKSVRNRQLAKVAYSDEPSRNRVL